MKPLYVVGDIHGCYDEMVNLIMKVKDDVHERAYTEGTLVFVGDYVDRGPKSYEVVEYVRNLQKIGPLDVVKLMGNHEDMLLYSWRDFMNNGGEQTMISYRSNGHDRIPQIHLDFYHSLRLYYVHEVPEESRRIVVSHAGLDPLTPLHYHSKDMLLWSRSSVGYDGEYVDNNFVVYGHTPLKQVLVRKSQIGIDTACVFGGELTCAVFDNSTNCRFIQTKAHRQYYG